MTVYGSKVSSVVQSSGNTITFAFVGRYITVMRQCPYLSNGDLCSFTHGNIVVPGSHSEHHVAMPVCLPSLEESIVTSDGLLHDVVTVVEHSML